MTAEKSEEPGAASPRVPWWGKLIRSWLAVAFPAAGHLLFDLRVEGRENFTNSPGTLIVANHKTDFDIVLLGPTIFWSNRGRGPGGRVAFVAAERMFLPGYVSDYILHGPRWLERLVYPANLSAVLKAIRAYPIGYLRSRKLKAHLRAVLETVGDIPVQDALARPVEEVIPGAPPHAPISRVLRYRYHAALDQEWGFSVLAPEIRKELRSRHVREVSESLRRFAAILDAGDSLYLAPEGGLETDGRFAEAKAGLFRIIATARAPIVLPVNLTYDFMATGRIKVFLTIGKELHGVKGWPRARLEQEIIDEISRMGTVTFSQLAAAGMRRLADPDGIIHAGKLRGEILRKGMELSRDGLRVDPDLFDPDWFSRRWRRFLAYARRRRLFGLIGAWIVGDRDAMFAPGSPFTYAANELAELARFYPVGTGTPTGRVVDRARA